MQFFIDIYAYVYTHIQLMETKMGTKQVAHVIEVDEEYEYEELVMGLCLSNPINPKP
jgi:hypothetical protein